MEPLPISTLTEAPVVDDAAPEDVFEAALSVVRALPPTPVELVHWSLGRGRAESEKTISAH